MNYERVAIVVLAMLALPLQDDRLMAHICHALQWFPFNATLFRVPLAEQCVSWSNFSLPSYERWRVALTDHVQTPVTVHGHVKPQVPSDIHVIPSSKLLARITFLAFVVVAFGFLGYFSFFVLWFLAAFCLFVLEILTRPFRSALDAIHEVALVYDERKRQEMLLECTRARYYAVALPLLLKGLPAYTVFDILAQLDEFGDLRDHRKLAILLCSQKCVNLRRAADGAFDHLYPRAKE